MKLTITLHLLIKLLMTGGVPLHWRCTSPLEVYLSTGGVPLHWRCTSALEVYLSTGGVPLHWRCTSALEVYLCTGGVPLHWRCTSPLEVYLSTCSSALMARIGMRSEILTLADMNITGFWVVTAFSLVKIYKCFGGTCCLTS